MSNNTNDLEQLLAVLPPRLRSELVKQGNVDDLVEIVLDLGRVPTARYSQGEIVLSQSEVQGEEIDQVVKQIGSFGADNRAGIERTLHRISAIRNRSGQIVGLTCRVGRAITGTVDIVRDLIETNQSVLIMGKPGVGKTTILRETARILSDQLLRRVVIVDTSNEIAGDGDIPHPAIGKSRRMQVPHPDDQHKIMIEAVENHMPEVIVIDEMGTILEAEAARTIAERGVQLIATAHGNTLQNLMFNPTLNDLVGGIQSVTLGDDEARRRGTQKSILERKAPPTFEIVIEIVKRGEMVVHTDVRQAVDDILKGRLPQTQVRQQQEDGEIVIKEQKQPLADKTDFEVEQKKPAPTLPLRVFVLGLTKKFFKQAAQEIGLAYQLTEDVQKADLMMVQKKYYAKRGKRIRQAETEGVPLYVVKNNTQDDVSNCFLNLANLSLLD
ncbi:MAG TPA: AAA family ATPase [Candidatus Wirthbacteria bacterium]|nr:AAA family ATPase [Candidatus Wirthbacteria bacterium]